MHKRPWIDYKDILKRFSNTYRDNISGDSLFIFSLCQKRIILDISYKNLRKTSNLDRDLQIECFVQKDDNEDLFRKGRAGDNDNNIINNKLIISWISSSSNLFHYNAVLHCRISCCVWPCHLCLLFPFLGFCLCPCASSSLYLQLLFHLNWAID